MKKSRQSSDSLSDDEIISRVLDGEKELYELIIRRHNQRLYKVSRGYVKDGDEAEDVVQEAFIKAYEQLPRFRGHSKFSTWLVRILINQALWHIKRSNRLASLPSEDGKYIEMKLPTRENPDEKVMNNELKGILEKVIDGLPERYRMVYVMRAIEEMSVAETSESLRISPANVKVRLNRAKEMLRDRIGRVYDDAPVYHFDLVRCDRIVVNVLERVKRYEPSSQQHTSTQ